MKSALITNYWKNSDGGGAKTYVVNLVDALQDKGANVSVLFREGDDPEHFCGGKNKVAFSFNCYRQLRKIRPGVIYSQETWYCLLPGVLYKKLHGCTLVHTEPDRGLPLPERVFFQSLLNACDLFVLPSLNEGNPTVLPEVLGCGKPFVGTMVGGSPGLNQATQVTRWRRTRNGFEEKFSHMRSDLRERISQKPGNNLQIGLMR